MIDFIHENLQALLVGAALLMSGMYMLTGFERQKDENGETFRVYQSGRWKRNLIVAGVFILLSGTLAFVPKGYAGVIYDWDGGINQQELHEGLNFVFPIKQHVTNVNTQVTVYVHNDETVFQHTKDFHEIRVPIAVNYRIISSEAAFVLQNIRGDIEKTIIEPAVLRSLRTEIGQVILDELAQKVAEVAENIQATIAPQALAHGIEIVYVSIEDTVVNKEFIKSVNDERISERAIITALNNVEVAINEAEEVFQRADGQARANERLADAEKYAITARAAALSFSTDEYLLWLRLQTWNGQLPDVLLGTGESEFIVNLP